MSSRTSLDTPRVPGQDAGVGVPSEEELRDLLLHQRIRKTREGLALSQAKFAKAVGVSERQVKRWESSTNQPEKANGEKIAELAERPPNLYTPREEELENPAIRLEAVLGVLGERIEHLDNGAAKGLREVRAAIRELRNAVHELATRLPPPQQAADEDEG